MTMISDFLKGAYPKKPMSRPGVSVRPERSVSKVKSLRPGSTSSTRVPIRVQRVQPLPIPEKPDMKITTELPESLVPKIQ